MRHIHFPIAVAICLAFGTANAPAHETEDKSPVPGFRPDSEHAITFANTVAQSSVMVYPTIVRTVDETTFSTQSQQQAIALLNKEQLTTPVAGSGSIDPGKLKGKAQFEIFQNDMQTIAEASKARETDAPYSLVLEILLPPGNRAVFGVHCYVFNRQGENAFSFLLNSHHQLFVDANMRVKDDSQASRNRLVRKATRLGVTALAQQLEAAAHHHEEEAADPRTPAEDGR